MHSEFYMVDEEDANMINECRANGGRVIAVGTTSTRTLETVTDENGIVHPGSGWTQIFIYPGYQFKAIDCLITNFHLPESTLLMLVSALAGRENILNAYNKACLLYTSDAADEEDSVDLGGRRNIKKKEKKIEKKKKREEKEKRKKTL